MNTMTPRWAAVCALALLASACIPRRVPLDPGFFNGTSRKVGVVLTDEPALSVQRMQTSNGGLIGALVDAALSGAAVANLEVHLKTIDVSPLQGLANAYVDKLKARGMDAKLVGRERLGKIDLLYSPDKAQLQWLARTEGIDSVVLLSPEGCGTSGTYYPFTPVYVVCSMVGRMVDLNTGKLVWAGSGGDGPLVAVQGEWNQAPDFPNVTAAIETSIANARQSMMAAFFESNGAQASR